MTIKFLDDLFLELDNIEKQYNIRYLICKISKLYELDKFPYNLLLTYYLLKHISILLLKYDIDIYSNFRYLENELNIKNEKKTLTKDEKILYEISLEKGEYIGKYDYDIGNFDKRLNIYIILTLLLILLDVFKINNENLSKEEQDYFIDFLLELLPLLPDYQNKLDKIKMTFIKLFLNIDFDKLRNCEKLKKFRHFYQKPLQERLKERMERGFKEQDAEDEKYRIEIIEKIDEIMKQISQNRRGGKLRIKKVVRKY